MGGSKIQLEPHILPRLMPDKRIYDFQIPRTTLTNGLKKWLFSGFMRFVRVPPYENWAFWTNFYFSWENGEFFGVKHVAPSSTLKMRKSHKKSARVYAYTHAYTQLRDGGGISAPLLGLIGLKALCFSFKMWTKKIFIFTNMIFTLTNLCLFLKTSI